jgi:ribosomal protein L13
MKTFSGKQESVKRDWYVIDANGKVLGRVATEVARRLRGKHKAEYTPHVDTGDYVIIINAGQDLSPLHRLPERFEGIELSGHDEKVSGQCH